jgi:hypothetical protein
LEDVETPRAGGRPGGEFGLFAADALAADVEVSGVDFAGAFARDSVAGIYFFGGLAGGREADFDCPGVIMLVRVDLGAGRPEGVETFLSVQVGDCSERADCDRVFAEVILPSSLSILLKNSDSRR